MDLFMKIITLALLGTIFGYYAFSYSKFREKH